jgi:CheY-like chemotaxis protein
VLVVDDDDDIRAVVSDVLADEGFDVLQAQHGLFALDIVRRRPVSAILLDMRMPQMDGWEFARTYRALPALPAPHAPIVVMTAAADAAARTQEIGADAYVGKPFQLEHLLAAVEDVIGRRSA